MKLTNCPTHAIVTDKAREEMAETGRFHKDTVLRSAGFSRYGSYIQWWFVRDNVARELGESLVPIPDSDPQWDPAIHPEKFLPGSKRKAVGYARASALAVPVVEAWVDRRYRQLIGTWKGVEALALSCQKQGVPIGFTPGTMPILQVGIQPAE